MFNLVRSITDSRNHLIHIIRKELNAEDNEKILDVGCGLGNFSPAVRKNYMGIDFNPSFISFAKKNYGNDDKKFFVMDAKKMKFKDKYFDKSIFISMLHHFSEQDNSEILKEIARITKKYTVLIDLIPTKRPIAGFLVKMDRGEYVRPLEEQKRIIQKHFKIVKLNIIEASLSSHSVMVCKPLK